MKLEFGDCLIGFFICYTGLFPLILALDSLFFQENLSYEDVIKFIRDKKSCNFTQQELPSPMQDKTLNTKESCLLLAIFEKSSQTSVLLSRVNVAFNIDGVKYKFDISPPECTQNYGLETVRFKLFCDLARGSYATTCKRETECEPGEKFCYRLHKNDTGFCIAKRNVYDSCEVDKQCTSGTLCKQVEGNKICYCSKGYEVINNQCLPGGLFLNEQCHDKRQCSATENTECIKNKHGTPVCTCKTGFISNHLKCLPGNRRLYQSCEVKEQCKGTIGATECVVIAGIQMCYCPVNYSVISEGCLKVGLTIGETCIVDQQCNGTKDGGRCVFNSSKKTQSCYCNEGFLRIGSVCLKGGIKLLEPCDHVSQCNGTINATVCKLIGKATLCYCKAHMLEFKGRCIEGGRKLQQPCVHHTQCTGTENATVCKLFGSESSCNCNDGTVELNGRCLEGEKKINQSCETGLQCTGTLYADVCGKNGECTCNSRFIQIYNECIMVNVTLGEVCIKSIQCTGTTHGGRCIDGTCFCDEGYVLQNYNCIKEQSTHNLINGYILVGASSFLIGGLCSSLILFQIYRSKKGSKKKRVVDPRSFEVDDRHSYTYVVQNGARNATEFLLGVRSVESQIYEYNHLHHIEEQMTEHAYDSSVQFSIPGKQKHSEDIYKKLHEEETSQNLTQNLYDVSESVAKPSLGQDDVSKTNYDYAKPL